MFGRQNFRVLEVSVWSFSGGLDVFGKLRSLNSSGF